MTNYLLLSLFSLGVGTSGRQGVGLEKYNGWRLLIKYSHFSKVLEVLVVLPCSSTGSCTCSTSEVVSREMSILY